MANSTHLDEYDEWRTTAEDKYSALLEETESRSTNMAAVQLHNMHPSKRKERKVTPNDTKSEKLNSQLVCMYICVC